MLDWREVQSMRKTACHAGLGHEFEVIEAMVKPDMAMYTCDPNIVGQVTPQSSLASPLG